ncbi:MAG: hypothetical protein ACYTHK_03810 [Planctomycetota bacterium]
MRLLALLLLAPLVNADEFVLVRRTCIDGLEELARYATGKKLFAYRAQCYEGILRHDADHAEARKWLRYKRGRDGSWTRSKSYRPPRNMSTDAEAEFLQRRAKLAERVLAEVKDAVADDAHPARRVAAWEIVLSVDADQADARRALGYERSGDRWLLGEIARAPARRKALFAQAREALREQAAVPAAQPTEVERGLGAWSGAWQGDSWRLLATVPVREAQRLVHLAASCDRYFGWVFGIERAGFPGRVLYVYADRAGYMRGIAAHRRVDGAGQRLAEKLTCYWIGKTWEALVGATNTGLRREWCARLPFAMLMSRHFRIRSKSGWVWEGFGLYLSYRMTGRRATWWVRRTGYAEKSDRWRRELWTRIMKPDSDWIGIARDLLKAGRRPDLRLLMSKSTNEMDGVDLIWSYALAAYLLEGFSDRAGAVLAAVGNGALPDAVFEQTLGLKLPDVQKRFAKWIAMRPPSHR